MAAVAATAVSCAPTDPEGLRTDPGSYATFEISLPYTAVYENENRGFLKCMTGSYYRMTFAIRPRIQVAQQSASLVLVHHGAWNDIWAIVDIAGNEKGSVIHAYTTSDPLMKDFPVVARRWAEGDFTCQEFAITTLEYPLSE
ncbi:MAG TPA: hypothetical protein VGL35_04430 [Rhizomicrobium sp.]